MDNFKPRRLADIECFLSISKTGYRLANIHPSFLGYSSEDNREVVVSNSSISTYNGWCAITCVVNEDSNRIYVKVKMLKSELPPSGEFAVCVLRHLTREQQDTLYVATISEGWFGAYYGIYDKDNTLLYCCYRMNGTLRFSNERLQYHLVPAEIAAEDLKKYRSTLVRVKQFDSGLHMPLVEENAL